MLNKNSYFKYLKYFIFLRESKIESGIHIKITFQYESKLKKKYA